MRPCLLSTTATRDCFSLAAAWAVDGLKRDYLQLNGLRALAAIAVVCFHYCPRGASWLNHLLTSGPAAVGFFFLLSGFLLAQRHREVADIRKFWFARLLRIYPMYLLAFLLFAPLAFEKYRHDPATLIKSLCLNVTMLQAWTSLSQSWNGPSWSLSVEAFLYATFPFVVKGVAKRPSVAGWGLLAMMPALVAIAVCNQWIPLLTWRIWIRNNPIFCLPIFCFGIALGLARVDWQKDAAPADWRITACLMAIVMAALLWPESYREVLAFGGIVPLFGALIVFCTFRSRVMDKVLGNRMMVTLGKASYITYIVQAPLWHYFQLSLNLINRRPLDVTTSSVRMFVLFVVMLLIASVWLDKFVDERIRGLISRRTKHSFAAARSAAWPAR